MVAMTERYCEPGTVYNCNRCKNIYDLLHINIFHNEVERKACYHMSSASKWYCNIQLFVSVALKWNGWLGSIFFKNLIFFKTARPDKPVIKQISRMALGDSTSGWWHFWHQFVLASRNFVGFPVSQWSEFTGTAGSSGKEICWPTGVRFWLFYYEPVIGVLPSWHDAAMVKKSATKLVLCDTCLLTK